MNDIEDYFDAIKEQYGLSVTSVEMDLMLQQGTPSSKAARSFVVYYKYAK